MEKQNGTDMDRRALVVLLFGIGILFYVGALLLEGAAPILSVVAIFFVSMSIILGVDALTQKKK